MNEFDIVQIYSLRGGQYIFMCKGNVLNNVGFSQQALSISKNWLILPISK